MNEKHQAGAAVFDPCVVADLTDDDMFAHVFVDKFRTLLPQRVRRIATTLGEGDVDEALDAVRSLKVSACTVGAGELCLLGRTLEAHLRRTDLAHARIAVTGLADAAHRADEALGAYLAA
ncbi:Hpt domain-containing protein [Nocardioides sp.]|uniref:Hpt domain-containing protein n=1 Tax=Nocardioides sp. TaxID=35761 RepID=UPI003784C617